MYGKELIIDLYGCDVKKFTRKSLESYLVELCDNVINMEREDLHWWDYEDDPEGYKNAPPHLKGVSAVQFITTSTIVIHTIDDKKMILINIFSCRDYNSDEVMKFTETYFNANKCYYTNITRGQEL